MRIKIGTPVIIIENPNTPSVNWGRRGHIELSYSARIYKIKYINSSDYDVYGINDFKILDLSIFKELGD